MTESICWRFDIMSDEAVQRYDDWTRRRSQSNTHQPNPGGRGGWEQAEGEEKRVEKKERQVRQEGKIGKGTRRRVRGRLRMIDRQTWGKGEEDEKKEHGGTQTQRKRESWRRRARKRSEALIDGVCAGLHRLPSPAASGTDYVAVRAPLMSSPPAKPAVFT